MLRRLLWVSVVGLLLTPVATAAGGGPSPGVSQGWDGVTASGIATRYVTVLSGRNTVLEMIRKRDGRVLRFIPLIGQWGIPTIANDGQTGGLSIDGRTLALAEIPHANGPLRSRSSFLIVDTKRWRVRHTVTLSGDFSFDVLSPRGHMLYLIQHVSAANLTHYVVRAYDLSNERLLPGRIADRTQRSWVMQGYPISRATTPNGRWAYTLYRNDGGYPFIHALDTVRGSAHCIGLPWHGPQDQLFNVRMSLRNAGQRLAIHWRNGTPIFSIDTKTFRLTRSSAARSGFDFPWWTLGIAAVVVVAFAALVRRGTTRQESTEAVPT